ncbi:MAG TPA: TonB-dependent receptor [Candidatus Angelobacter sp.]|nr:TonB-dependent receptor [Candidatus Angelobacter sp.]
MGALRKGLFSVVVCAAILTLLAIPLLAQLPTATILGTARDQSGGVLPGVTVTIINVETGLTRSVKTADDGSYRAVELPVGNYEVKAEHSGFRSIDRTGITLEVTQQAVINLDFQVGTAEQQVIVNEEVPMVNTQDATLGGTVNETKMEQLPLNGRNYIDLALYQPGVTPDKNQNNQQGTSFSVDGAPVRSNNFTLDGAVLQTMLGRSPVAGESGNALGMDGVKEFKIVAGTFQAEYGLAMGSQMVAVSKGGTNQWHGDLFEYLRNSALDANDVFQRDAGSPIAPLRKNQFGAAGGGPIKKDKTFFYVVYEGIRETKGVPINNTVPEAGCHPAGASAANGYGAGAVITAANCPDLIGNPDDSIGTTPTPTIGQSGQVVLSPFTAPLLALAPLPNVPAVIDTDGSVTGFAGAIITPASQVGSDHDSLGENYGQVRFDQTISDKDAFFARYTIDNAFQNQTQEDYSYFRYTVPARNQWITLAENHIFSPFLFNAGRFSFSRTNSSINLANVGLPNNGLGPSIVPGFSTGVVDMNGGGANGYAEFGSANAAPTTFNRQNIYTLSDDINWIHGKHSFKFGLLLNRFNEASQATNSFNGQLQYNNFSDFIEDIPAVVEFAPTFATENRDFIFNTYGFYGQDDWRVTPRLTVNLGLRYEFMNTPHELSGRQSRIVNDFADPFTLGPVIKNQTLRDFSPRIGLAYDLFGNGKTAIRGGAGIYYDMGNIGTALGQTANGSLPYAGLVDILPTCTSSASPCTTTDWENQLGTCYTATLDPNCVGGNNTGFPIPIPDAVRSAYQPNVLGVFTPTYLDYNWKSPYMIQYNASVQQQLPWDMALGVAYVGNHGVHLPMVRDGNPVPPTSFGNCGDPASVCVNGKVPFWDTNCTAPLPAGCSGAYLNLNPNFGSNINVATAASSRYNALQIDFRKRTSHGLEFQVAYTRSLLTDETQGQSNIQDCIVSGGLLGVYPLNPTVDKGPACFNIKNNWEINTLYHLPSLKTDNGFLAKATNGWFVSSIVAIQSGQPFSPITGNNRSNSGVAQAQQGDRVNINTPALIAEYFKRTTNGGADGLCTWMPGDDPKLLQNAPYNVAPCLYTPIPYNPNTVITGKPDQWFNPAMFSITPQCTGPGYTGCSPTLGQLGTAGRNILTGPPERDWDFSLVKDTKLGFLGEEGLLEFRAEFFNVLNHANFSGDHLSTAVFSGDGGDIGPFSEPIKSTAGQVTRQLADNQRQIQFALRLEF